MYRDLIQTDYFRVVVVDDVEAVEVCGALKVGIYYSGISFSKNPYTSTDQRKTEVFSSV